MDKVGIFCQEELIFISSSTEIRGNHFAKMHKCHGVLKAAKFCQIPLIVNKRSTNSTGIDRWTSKKCSSLKK